MSAFAEQLIRAVSDGKLKPRFVTPTLSLTPYRADIAMKYYVEGVLPDGGIDLVCRHDGAKPVYTVEGTEHGPEADMAVLRATLRTLAWYAKTSCSPEGPSIPRVPFDPDKVQLIDVQTVSDPCVYHGSPFTVRFRYSLDVHDVPVHTASMSYIPEDGHWDFRYPAAQQTDLGWRSLMAALLSQWADCVTVEPYVSDRW